MSHSTGQSEGCDICVTSCNQDVKQAELVAATSVTAADKEQRTALALATAREHLQQQRLLKLQRRRRQNNLGTSSATAQPLFSNNIVTSATSFEQQR
jgi:hypothetical protein